MSHPFSQKKKIIIIYAVNWLLISAIHFGFLYSVSGFSLGFSLIDALVYTNVFALIGLIIHYGVAYSGLDKRFGTIVFNQIISAVVIVAIWLVISYILAGLLMTAFDIQAPDTTGWLQKRIINGIIYYVLLALVYYLISSYESNQKAKQDVLAMESRLRETQLQALKSQINPHFLFNSLNSISFLVKQDSDKAREMLSVLSDYFRYSLKQQSNTATIADELVHCRKYLEIEKIRFSAKLIIEEEIDGQCLGFMLPAMLLQPIYENAVKHGVYESDEPVIVKTQLVEKPDCILISISNNYDADALVRKGEGIGLKNAAERLRLMFGTEGLLEIKKEPSVFTVVITLPKKN
ncbi:MAG TPA: histidine kinase [Bacteroidales bacterium]|nr:histidine kinase [Bacteroidales bacterium]HOE05283.1 histidine kinase [Bacteroidales bacterium]